MVFTFARHPCSAASGVIAALVATALPAIAAGAGNISVDPQTQLTVVQTESGSLSIRIDPRRGAVIDQLVLGGQNVLSSAGSRSGVKIGDDWAFSNHAATPATVKLEDNHVTVSGIRFDTAACPIEETWTFHAEGERLHWTIDRRYAKDAVVDEIAFPQWSFARIDTWTGGLLDNGGVVWTKYLDRERSTYGSHFDAVTFWNAGSAACLRITPRPRSGLTGAGRFTREPSGSFSLTYAMTDEPLATRHELRRFLPDRDDLWAPMSIQRGSVSIEYVLESIDYRREYDRGTFVGLNGDHVRELLNTVARYGVIDRQLTGGNGWRSGYICLHEPWFGQIAAVLNDDHYTRNLVATLDNFRDHAIDAEGRVKSRWCYGDFDAMPGTYDANGFYETRWGYLLDSQPSYVMNVSELYQLTGDLAWLKRHKQACENALDYLLRREVNDSGLLAMLTDSHTQERGSDWIDIIWASYENALVNAEMYGALQMWADAEDALGDAAAAERYRAFAAKMKATFNRNVADGGFWDPENRWYVYWRDKDGSVHGNNLVTPVNFAAIGYGLCDDPERVRAILDQLEAQTATENLLYWPLNAFPFDRAEGHGNNFPFPRYENGDLFLSWGELGVRAYSEYDPALAVKYVRNVLNRYEKDGLSFQRYLRGSQQGEGDDILAGNCMPVVGLYRNIYGIQPRADRLFLDPHLTPELAGTVLRYPLRGQPYEIELRPNAYTVRSGTYSVTSDRAFAVDIRDDGVQYFANARTRCSVTVRVPSPAKLSLAVSSIADESGTPQRGTINLNRAANAEFEIDGLPANSRWTWSIGRHRPVSVRADEQGKLKIMTEVEAGRQSFELTPVVPAE